MMKFINKVNHHPSIGNMSWSNMTSPNKFQRDNVLKKRNVNLMEGRSSRSKRCRDELTPCFKNKRNCIKGECDDDNGANIMSFTYPEQQSYCLNEDDIDAGVDNEREDMDINGTIVSNFNTISFDNDFHNTKKAPSFPPLKRSGRKIDFLVDDLIRKSSRINPDFLQVSIPPSNFEFQMPSFVSACGSPTRDARFLSSTENRDLALNAIRHATIPYLTRDSAHCSQTEELCIAEDKLSPSSQQAIRERSSFVSPTKYHLGQLTHSDWFDDCAASDQTYYGYTRNSHDEDKVDEENYGCDQSDEDCDDMYIDR